MEPVAAISKALAEYGPWGLVALFALALRYVFTKYDGVQEKRIEDSKEVTRALVNSTDAIKESNRLQLMTEARLAAIGDKVNRRGG